MKKQNSEDGIRVAELSAACEEFGLNVEIIEPEDQSGPILVLTGGFPGPDVLQEINRRVFLIEPRIQKILLDIPHEEV